MRTLLVTCMVVALTGPRLSFGQGANDIKPEAEKPLTVEDLKRELDNLRKDLQTLQSQREELSKQMLKLQGDKDGLKTEVDRLRTQLAEGGTLKDPRYSEALPKNIFDATSATVEIENNTGGPIEMYLNGVRLTFPQGRTSRSVPYGPLYLKFVYFRHGEEWIYKDKDWNWDGKQFRLSIQILSGMLHPSG